MKLAELCVSSEPLFRTSSNMNNDSIWTFKCHWCWNDKIGKNINKHCHNFLETL